MPSRAYASLLLEREATERDFDEVVSMPSRASTSLLLQDSYDGRGTDTFRCQCPLGLVPHCYGVLRIWPDTMEIEVCQCPLGLVPHFYARRAVG